MGLAEGEAELWKILLIPNIINVVILGSFLVIIWVYNNRRSHFPIRGRGSRPVLLVAWISVIMLLSIAVRGPYLPCVFDTVIYITGSHCACIVYLYRVAVLLVRHDIAHEISFESRNTVRKPRSCLHGKGSCNLLDKRRWGLFLVCYEIILAILVVVLAIAYGENWHCDSSSQGVLTLASNAILIVALVPVLTWMGCKLRKYPSDGRRIAAEFRFVAFFMVVALIGYTALSQATDVPYPSIYFMDVVCLGLLTSSMCYPIHLTYRYQAQRRIPTTSSNRASLSCSIETLLPNEEFRGAFLIHLKSEFNAESLIFWQSVSDYKAKGDRPAAAMIEDITEILDTYLGKNAPYQLNVSDESVRRTRAIVQQAQESGTGFLQVFDELLNEVVALMKNDPLPRFLRTPAGRASLSVLTTAQEEAGKRSPATDVKEVLMSALIPNHDVASDDLV